MQLSINSIGNAIFLIFLLNNILLNKILKNPKQVENARNNKVKIKLLKFEYTLLNVVVSSGN